MNFWNSVATGGCAVCGSRNIEWVVSHLSTEYDDYGAWLCPSHRQEFMSTLVEHDHTDYMEMWVARKRLETFYELKALLLCEHRKGNSDHS